MIGLRYALNAFGLGLNCLVLLAPHVFGGWRYVFAFACAAWFGWELFDDDG